MGNALSEIAKSLVERNTASHVMQILGGKHPKVNSYALLTAENPFAQEHGPLENAEFNRELESDLRQRGLGFIKVKGKFGGNAEHSYLVVNPPKDVAIQLGEKFGQESIIHGSKDDSGQMVHNYIRGGETLQTRKTFGQLHRDTQDMYSTVKGRKMNIPFFDPEKSGKKFQGGKVVPGDADVDKDPTVNVDRTPDIQRSTKDKVALTTPDSRKVWVKKQNVTKYKQLGYKDAK